MIEWSNKMLLFRIYLYFLILWEMCSWYRWRKAYKHLIARWAYLNSYKVSTEQASILLKDFPEEPCMSEVLNSYDEMFWCENEAMATNFEDFREKLHFGLKMRLLCTSGYVIMFLCWPPIFLPEPLNSYYWFFSDWITEELENFVIGPLIL